MVVLLVDHHHAHLHCHPSLLQVLPAEVPDVLHAGQGVTREFVPEVKEAQFVKKLLQIGVQTFCSHGLSRTSNPVEDVAGLAEWNTGGAGAPVAVDAVIDSAQRFVVPHINTVEANTPVSVHQHVGTCRLPGLEIKEDISRVSLDY